MVSFDIKDKVALITGGASGLGFQFALKLLEKDVRGVTLADVNSNDGSKALQEIEEKFGKNRAIFVKTDVCSEEEFENAFKATIEKFKNIDILINNAGIFFEKSWEKEVEINMKGHIRGILLSLDNYISNYKSGPEGLILNISSVTALSPFVCIPVYSATKFAINGMTLAFGSPAHFVRTKVRVVAVCPGATNTPLISSTEGKFLGPAYESVGLEEFPTVPVQESDQVATHVIKVIEKAETGTIWVIEANEPAYKFELPDRFKQQFNKVYL